MTPETSTTTIQAKQKKYKLLITVFSIAISVTIFALRDIIPQFQSYGYIGIFIISALGNATLFLPAPALVAVVALGASLNPYLLALIASFGAAIGESVGYFVGFGGKVLVEHNTAYKKTKHLMDKYGVFAIAFLAAIPNPLFDLAGIMAGIGGIRFSRFFLAAWAGSFVKYLLAAGAGLGVMSFF